MTLTRDGRPEGGDATDPRGGDPMAGSPMAGTPDPAEGYEALRADLARRAKVQTRFLMLERAVRAFWPAWTVLAVFLGLALTGAFELLGRELHMAALAGFGLGLAAAVLHGIRAWRRPTAAEATEALDAALPDRPVAAFADEIAIGATDPAAQALWAAHRARMARRAALARPRPADLRLAPRDPYALRLSALVLLIMGGVVAALDGGERFAAAFAPGAPAPGQGPALPAVEAWASPPAYTGAEMVYLTEREGETIALPAGSRLQLRVYDAPVAPVLGGDLTVAGADQAGSPMGEGAHEFALTLTESGRLEVRAGADALAGWTFETAPDAAPQIDFTTDAAATETRALEFGFRASDDYGVVSAWAEITLDRSRMETPEGAAPAAIKPIRIELPLSFKGAETEVEETLVEDLTGHPWAGLPVTITLRAEDAAGQVAASEPLAATLPERIFTDAMARSFIEERRGFAGDVARAALTLQRLRAVTAFPEDWFGDETGPYLVGRTAMRRLGYALEDGRVEAEALSVLELLWRAALLMEEGDLSSAAEKLARAQKRLQEAIDRGAPPEEIAKLMDDLRQAMNEYLAEMMRQAMENMDQLERQQGRQDGQPQQSLDMADLQKMLDELQKAAEAGDREAAQKMLQALAQMLQNLRMQAQQGGQGQQGQGGQMMEQLQDMLRNQGRLADRSFGEMQRRQGEEGQGGQNGQRGQRGQGRQGGPYNPYGRPNRGGVNPDGLDGMPGGDGREQGRGGPTPGTPEDMGDLAERQEALRQLLEDLRGQLPGGLSPEAEEALKGAEESMDGAGEALRGDAPDEALEDQVQAMEKLREGARQLGQALRREAQRGQGDRAARGDPDGQDRGRDPMGRPVARDGSPDGGDTKVPSEEELKRARELLDEIRRRSGERQRPEMELDYLRRLLERF